MSRPTPPAPLPNDVDLCFQLVDIVYRTKGSWREKHCAIYLFGVTERGNSITVVVENFFPYFYLLSEQPDIERRRRLQMQSDLESALGGQRGPPGRVTKLEFVGGEKRSLWGYRGDVRDPLWRVTLNSTDQVTPLRNALAAGDVRSALGSGHRGYATKTFESDFPFVLRYMVDTGITGFGWVRLPAGAYEEARPDEDFEFCNSQLCVRMLGADGRPEPIPGRLDCARLILLSFDIECTSRRGFFPDAEQDAVIQIACYATVHGTPESPAHGTPKPISYELLQWRTCGRVDSDPPGARVRCFDSEPDLMRGFGEYVRQLDPDLLTGWNIMNFDLPYLLKRADALGLEDWEFKQHLSRCDRQPTVSTTMSGGGGAWKRRKKPTGPGANGTAQDAKASESKDKEVVLPGRVVYDAIAVVRKEFKERSYTLDAISRRFLGDDIGKDPIKHTEIAHLFDGTDDDRAKLAHYCLRDAWLPSRILQAKKLVVRSVEMARVTTVPLALLMTRGESTKVLVQIYRWAQRQGYVVPYVEKRGGRGDKYEGAVVLEPKKGFHQGLTVVLDFSSLYPRFARRCRSFCTVSPPPASAASCSPTTFATRPCSKEELRRPARSGSTRTATARYRLTETGSSANTCAKVYCPESCAISWTPAARRSATWPARRTRHSSTFTTVAS